VKTVRINHNRQVGENARVPTWPKSAVRIGFGLIWLVDAAFKFSPDFRTGILGMVKAASTGQPSWLHGWFHFWISAVQAHPNFWAYGIAGLELVIALALILGFARKVTYIVTIFSALFIWGIAEGFGGPYSATSTDIGAAVMYAVVALSLLVLSLQCGPSRYSVDYWIEQRVSWWHWVAEFGAHWHPAPGEQEAAPLAPPPLTPPVVPVASTSPGTSSSGNGSARLAPPVVPVASVSPGTAAGRNGSAPLAPSEELVASSH
jgi:nitrite reductase (NO-forming)